MKKLHSQWQWHMDDNKLTYFPINDFLQKIEELRMNVQCARVWSVLGAFWYQIEKKLV